MMKTMKVLFIPFAKGNPFHQLLAKSLEKKNVKAIKGTYLSLFTLTRQALSHKDVDIISLAWLSPHFISHSRWKTILRAVLFIIDINLIKLLGKKIIWVIHNKYNHEKEHADIEIFVCQCVAKLCDAVKIEQKCLVPELTKLYKLNLNKIHIIPEGNYIDAYPNIISQEDARKSLGLNSNDHVYLFLGNIRGYKGVLELISTFNKIKIANTKLIIAGKPASKEIKSKILSLINGNQNILTRFEFIPNEEVQVYMNTADLVVLPYEDILTSGMVLLAMSFKKPVIAPAKGTIAGIVNYDHNFIYQTQSKLGDTLITASTYTRGKLASFGIKNYYQCLEYDWDKIALLTQQMYKEILDMS